MAVLAAFHTTALPACVRLPMDWRGATRAEAFEQSGCTRTVELSQPGRMKAYSEDGRLRIDFLDARFRCDQKLTGYFKVGGGKVDVLVQPVEMQPLTVAKCDCLYDIHLEVPRVAAGTYEIRLFRRWDNRHSPNDPVQVGSDRVTVN